MRVGVSGPASRLCNPGFAGVGIDGDSLAGDGADAANERQDVARRSAVHADGDDLRRAIKHMSALFDRLAVTGLAVVRAGEADLSGEVGKVGERFEDRFRLGERRDGLEGEEVGIRVPHRIDAFCVEGDELGVPNVVAAMEFRSVVQGCAISAE